MLKIITVVGARPQFVKAAAISRVIANRYSGLVEEILVHTGQHHDENMSDVFFDELRIPAPRYNLEIAGGTHGVMTGRMLEGIEKVLQKERPNWVLVYGDTNSTLAAALAAAKMNIPVAHVEAGLRSFNMHMPEEVNRIVADRLSSLLLCPTEASVANLEKEGRKDGVHFVGDVMYDISLSYRKQACEQSDVLSRLGLHEGAYVLATCHRAENTDHPNRLRGIVEALERISRHTPVVLPMHPRTRKCLAENKLLNSLGQVILVEPLAFLDMISLEQSAKVILTDSGGVQKEAFFYGVPCVTMRDETEWIETVAAGWNVLVGADAEAIVQAVASSDSYERRKTELYGVGNAAELCLSAIINASSVY